MKKEKYAGAREMDKFVDYMWGWQVTTPEAVDKAKWEQVYEVYVEDKYKLEIKEFFEKNNPWAIQSINARMLEAIRKEYWNAPEKIKKKLAVEYALNVIEKGFACCDHTCNNPALNQMVVNIISIPGILSPEKVNQFKVVVSKATGMNLEKAVKKRVELQKNLAEYKGKVKQDKDEIRKEKKEVKSKNNAKEKIEGYEIVEDKQEKEDSKLTTSGSAWIVMIIVLGFMILFFAGWLKKIKLK